MNEKEIWKSIIGYENRYMVSNLGNVISLKHASGKSWNRPVKQRASGFLGGYLSVSLRNDDGKDYTHMVHRLVAFAFIPNDDLENKPIINHKDENKKNNHADNLEWCDHKYNLNYGTSKSRISAAHKGRKNPQPKDRDSKNCKPVKCITTGEIFYSRMEAKEKYGINDKNITTCCKGKRKSAGKLNGVPLLWEYAD